MNSVVAKIRDAKFSMLEQDVIDQANKIAFDQQSLKMLGTKK